MSLGILVVAFLALMAAGTLVNSGMLMLAARWCRAGALRFGRSLRVILLLGLLHFVIGGGSVLLFRRFETSPVTPLIAVLGLFLDIYLPIRCIRWMLATTSGRAAFIFVVWFVLGIAVNLPLAFLFRATVAEAFVVPTGASASTILGQHYHFDCPDCDCAFDVNCNIESSPTRRYPFYCPNCGFEVLSRNSGQQIAIQPGDRLIAVKLPSAKPQRWELSVFKTPTDPTHQQNYVKRVVGLPGETLMILDGDLYRKTSDHWEILPKPRSAQDALWRLIHDNDLTLKGLPRPAPFQNPWTCADGQGWQLPPSGLLQFNNPAASATLRFDESTRRNAHASTDYFAYDQPMVYRGQSYRGTISNGTETPVADLKLHLRYDRKSGDGPLRLTLSKYDDAFTAELTPSAARLLHTRNGQTTQLGSAPIPTNQPLDIEFLNVDYRVTLRIAGQDLLSTTPANYAPDVPQLLADFSASRPLRPATVAISAEKQSCALSHLSLWRDIYYTNAAGSRDLWGSPSQPAILGPAEYFVLGDNTLISGDSRVWNSPAVPEKSLLALPRCIYWPPSRWAALH